MDRARPDSAHPSEGDWVNVALELLGGSAGVYYYPPAASYAHAMEAWRRYSLIAGNVTTGTLFLMNATDGFLQSVRREMRTPTELSPLLHTMSRRDLLLKYLKVGLGSLICAVPFAIAVALFPVQGCTKGGCLGLTVAHSALSNTILHAISMGLILTPAFWYYRLPMLPFEMLWAQYKLSRLPAGARRDVEFRREAESVYARYRAILAGHFARSVCKLVYDEVGAPGGRLMSVLNDPTLSMRSVSVAAYPTMADASPATWLATTNQLLLDKVMPLIGALFMVVGSIGWVVNSFYLFDKLGWNLPQVIGLGTLPAYSMAVLSAFYGAIFIPRIWSFLTSSWKAPLKKLPVEASLYPVSFTLFTLINAYLSYFSYATANVLIEKIFSAGKWDAYRPHLLSTASLAMQTLSFISLMDLFALYRRKWAAAYSDGDHKLIARMQIESGHVAERFQQMRGEAIMAYVASCSGDMHTRLGIDAGQLSADQQKLRAINDKTWRPPSRMDRLDDSWLRFLRRKLSPELRPLVADDHLGAEYHSALGGAPGVKSVNSV